jgi:hypothetical protein
MSNPHARHLPRVKDVGLVEVGIGGLPLTEDMAEAVGHIHEHEPANSTITSLDTPPGLIELDEATERVDGGCSVHSLVRTPNRERDHPPQQVAASMPALSADLVDDDVVVGRQPDRQRRGRNLDLTDLVDDHVVVGRQADRQRNELVHIFSCILLNWIPLGTNARNERRLSAG